MLRYPLSLAVPALLVAVTLLVLTLTLSAPLGGYGADNVFAYHPAFMSVAFLLLLPLGVLSYSVDLGEAGNAAYPDRDSRRVLHGVLNLFGACLAVCGYLVAFVYHAAKGKDLAGHLALNFNGGPAIPSRTAHVFLGLIAVLGSVVMAASGLYKFVVVARDGHRRVFRWHSYAGPVVWGCGLLCICLAAYFEFLEADKSSASYKPGPHWNGGAVTAIVIGVVAVVVGVAVQSRLGDRSHLMRSLEDEDEESDGKRGGLMLNS